MPTTQAVLAFRKATIADVGHILILVNTAFCGDSGRAGWTSEATFLNYDRIDEAGVITRINQSGAFILLAHDTSGALVGCCFIQSKGDGLGYLGLLAVDPWRQASGLGKMILTKAEVIAKAELSIRLIEGRVIWPREEMISWYIRRGYTKTDRTEPFPYAQVGNCKAIRGDLYFVIMEKEL